MSLINPPIILLVNPAAGAGRGASNAPAVARALAALGTVERFDTTGPGDETRIARIAAERGARVLAVVGGDGSVSRAAHGLLETVSDVPLAVFGAGTGNDFVKSLGTPVHDVAAVVSCIAAGTTQSIDVGFVNDVPFVNAAGFGFDVHVLERMAARSPRSLFRGTAAYVITALRALSGYEGLRVSANLSAVMHSSFTHSFASDDTSPRPSESATDSTLARRHLLLVFANGRYFGGAFHIAPTASLSNGLLDAVFIHDASPLRRLTLFAKAIRGAHLSASEVEHSRGARFTLSFDSPPQFEADGELHQALTRDVTISVRPAALRVVR